MYGKRLVGTAIADHEDPGERSGRKRLLVTALLGVCLLALVTSGCGTGATADKNKNQGASKGGASSTKMAAAASMSSSQGGLPQGSETVKLDPADFTTHIDNPYWPMSPGSKWVYSETDTKGSKQKVVVEPGRVEPAPGKRAGEARSG